MNQRWTRVHEIRARRATEGGRPLPLGRQRLALLYPAPYRVGMASLGFQWVAELLAGAGFGVERAFLPDSSKDLGTGGDAILTYETESPLSDLPLVAVSIAWEPEIGDLARALDASGIPALRRERGPEHPRILIGGPLTGVNPRILGPLADAILVGEADETVVPAVEAFFGETEQTWLDRVASLPGGWVPGRGDNPPLPALCPVERLPARSRIWGPDVEFPEMFLVEGERGCGRACSFCVMRRGAERPHRIVDGMSVLDLVPSTARRVGLVGAAIGDHPDLVAMIERLLAEGREVGLSALRADRLARQPELGALLRRAGLRTLTLASDAASQRLRDSLRKGIREEHLLDCARMAASNGFAGLKIYMMVGLPDETDADLDELVAFMKVLARIHPVTLGVSPFVPKPGTPMAEASFAGIHEVDRRLTRITKGLRGVAELSPSSARWAWVEMVLTHGGQEAGEAAVRAARRGGGFQAWRKELAPFDQ